MNGIFIKTVEKQNRSIIAFLILLSDNNVNVHFPPLNCNEFRLNKIAHTWLSPQLKELLYLFVAADSWSVIVSRRASKLHK